MFHISGPNFGLIVDLLACNLLSFANIELMCCLKFSPYIASETLCLVFQVVYLCQPITHTEYNEAVMRDPKACPLFAMGDLRSGRQV
jgi:hypothetical protein